MRAKLFKLMMGLAVVGLLFTACKDDDDDDNSGEASFTSTATDDWNYTFTNTSTATGTASWDLGNGQVANGDEVTAYYPLEGTYTVVLTLSTSSGTLKDSTTVTVSKADASYFSHPFFKALTGGLDDADGKAWLMDKNLEGHYGLGPGSGDWSSYHASAGGFRTGYGKELFGYYDDELTFVLSGMVAKYWAGSDGKVVCRQPEQAKKSDYYKNGVDPEGTAGYEYVVDYAQAANESSPLTQKFNVTIEKGKGKGQIEDLIAIQFIGDAPMFAFFDPGVVNNTWYVDSYDDHHMTLYCQADAEYDIDGKTTYYQIKMAEKGHLSEPAKFTSSVKVGAGGAVEFSVAHAGGAKIKSVEWDFGDGEKGTGEKANHTYKTSLTYNASVTVTDELNISKAETVVVTVTSATAATEPTAEYATFEGLDKLTWSSMKDGDGIVADPANATNKVFQATLGAQWANTFAGFGGELDITTNTIFKFKVYGKKGYRLAVNLYDKSGHSAAPYGADAIPLQLYYDILADDTWEEVVFDFSLHPSYDAKQATGWYDDYTIFLNPGSQPAEPNEVIYLDDFKGPALP